MLRRLVPILAIALIVPGYLWFASHDLRSESQKRESGEDLGYFEAPALTIDRPASKALNENPMPEVLRVVEQTPLPADIHAVSPQARFADPPGDPDWAPMMEATLDSLIRGLGYPVQDIRKIVCQTKSCSAAVQVQASYFQLTESGQQEVMTALTKKLGAIVDSGALSGIDHFAAALAKTGFPDEDNRTEAVGIVLSFGKATVIEL